MSATRSISRISTRAPTASSVAFLPRSAHLSFRGDHLDAGVLARNYQTLDQALPQFDRPYTEARALYARGNWRLAGALPLVYGFDSEATDFRRSEAPEGWRVGVAPNLMLDYSGPGYFVRPAVSMEGTCTGLRSVAANVDDSPDRVLPIASLDAGLTFERGSGRRGQRRITLEPRLMYLYVPYRAQDDLPLFDSGDPDLNSIQLFRTNRYVGPRPHQRRQPDIRRLHHAALQQRERRAFPVDHHRTDVLFPHTARAPAR